MMESNYWYIFINKLDFVWYILLIALTGYFIYQLISQDIVIRAKHLQNRIRVRRQQISVRAKSAPKSRLSKHLFQLLSVQNANTDMMAVRAFYFVMIFSGISITSLIFYNIKDLVIGLLCGVVAMLIPYLFIFIKASGIRSEVENEGLEVVQALLHSYSASGNKMYKALNDALGEIKNKRARTVMTRLLSDLQTAHDDESIRQALDIFIFSTGKWGLRLGNIILKGYVYQENVSSALLTLQQQLTENNKMLEEEQTNANDVANTSILLLILFPASLVGLDYLTNPHSYWDLQFNTPLGLVSFIISLLLLLISQVVGFTLRKPKKDI